MVTIIKREEIMEEVHTTNSIRFKERADGKRIMQQLHWVVTLELDRVPVKRRGEWRDVECVGPDAPDVEA